MPKKHADVYLSSSGSDAGYKIFLLGMMGSGKSHWCSQVAKKLKCGGYDLDYLIEMNEEKTISELFAEDGEDYFRKTEAKILRWFGEKKSFVLATGGGTPCFMENIKWMNEHGITIFIDEPIDILAARLEKEKSHRPLISQLSEQDLKVFLINKSEERKAFYAQAKVHLSGTEISLKNILEAVKH
jgi:shikimate kinase